MMTDAMGKALEWSCICRHEDGHSVEYYANPYEFCNRYVTKIAGR